MREKYHRQWTEFYIFRVQSIVLFNRQAAKLHDRKAALTPDRNLLQVFLVEWVRL